MTQVFLSVKVTLSMMDHKIFFFFYRFLKIFMMSVGLTEAIVNMESKVLSNEKITPPTTWNNSVSSKLK